VEYYKMGLQRSQEKKGVKKELRGKKGGGRRALEYLEIKKKRGEREEIDIYSQISRRDEGKKKGKEFYVGGGGGGRGWGGFGCGGGGGGGVLGCVFVGGWVRGGFLGWAGFGLSGTRGRVAFTPKRRSLHILKR